VLAAADVPVGEGGGVGIYMSGGLGLGLTRVVPVNQGGRGMGIFRSTHD